MGTYLMMYAVTWTDIVQSAAATATALGLLIGGAWAIYRFRSSRSFMPRCSVQLTPTLPAQTVATTLKVDAVIGNCGTSVVVFDPADKVRIEVSVVNDGVTPRSGTEWPRAEWPLVQDLLALDGSRVDQIELEPGQDVRRSVLFALPSDWSAARVLARVTHGAGAETREWATTEIVVREADSQPPRRIRRRWTTSRKD